MNRTEKSITLIRHGPPAVSLTQRVRGHQFRQFIERYDAAKLSRRAVPPSSARQAIAQADWVFASHRPRARHTAEMLGISTPHRVDAQFREIEFPVDFPWPFRLTALTWTVIALSLWRLGYSVRCESFWRAKQRAKDAAEQLEQQLTQSDQNGSVVLVAHGGINRLIAKELRQRGWKGPRIPYSWHWGCTTYCR